MAEIERAAQKTAEREKKAAPKVESAADREQRHLKQKRELLRESLTGSPTITFLDVVEAAVYFVLPFVLVLGFTNWDLGNPGVMGLLVVSSGASIVAGLSLRARAMEALRISRIRRVGQRFDAERYLAQLSERRPTARLVVEVSFARPPDQELQSRATGLIKGARAEWKNGALKLESHELDGKGSVGRRGKVRRFFTNRLVHDCFTHLVLGVVPALSASNPVVKLKVEVTGKTASLDESAGSW
jgi:hypothetical protein